MTELSRFDRWLNRFLFWLTILFAIVIAILFFLIQYSHAQAIRRSWGTIPGAASRFLVQASSHAIDIPGVAGNTNPATMSAWIYLTSLPSSGSGYMIYNDGSGWGSPSIGWDYRNTSGTLQFNIWSSVVFGAYRMHYFNITLNANQWYHVAYTMDSAGDQAKPRMYLDGRELTWSSGDADWGGAFGGTAAIGKLQWDTDIYYFNGRIAQLGRWKTRLPIGKIRNLAAGGRLDQQASPKDVVCLYPLGYQDFPRAVDIGPNGLHSTTTTGTSLADGPPFAEVPYRILSVFAASAATGGNFTVFHGGGK